VVMGGPWAGEELPRLAGRERWWAALTLALSRRERG